MGRWERRYLFFYCFDEETEGWVNVWMGVFFWLVWGFRVAVCVCMYVYMCVYIYMCVYAVLCKVMQLKEQEEGSLVAS